MEIIGHSYQEQFLETGSIIEIENAKRWIACDDKVDQIDVEKDFKGKYDNMIGLGSTRNDLKRYIGDYIQVYDTVTYECKADNDTFQLKLATYNIHRIMERNN